MEKWEKNQKCHTAEGLRLRASLGRGCWARYGPCQACYADYPGNPIYTLNPEPIPTPNSRVIKSKSAQAAAVHFKSSGF